MGVRVTTVVIDDASSIDLVTLAVVKDELGISVTTSDAKLKRYITAASVAIANHCGRVFPLETVQDTFSIQRARLQALGEPSLQLSRYPVAELATITEAGLPLVDGTDFRVDPSSGILYRLNADGDVRGWFGSPVVVTYDGGYDDFPEDLQDAAVRVIRGRWFAKDRDPFVRQENIPGVRDVSYWVPTGTDAANLSPDVIDIIDNYRVPVAA